MACAARLVAHEVSPLKSILFSVLVFFLAVDLVELADVALVVSGPLLGG